MPAGSISYDIRRCVTGIGTSLLRRHHPRPRLGLRRNVGVHSTRAVDLTLLSTIAMSFKRVLSMQHRRVDGH